MISYIANKTSGKILENVFSTLAVLVTALMFFILVKTYGPDTEGIIFPPATNFAITSAQIVAPNQVKLFGTINNIREECGLFAVNTLISGEPSIGISDNILLKPRVVVPSIKGTQTWGPWTLNSNKPLKNKTIDLHGHYKCHDLYLVHTVFGQYKVASK